MCYMYTMGDANDRWRRNLNNTNRIDIASNTAANLGTLRMWDVNTQLVEGGQYRR